MKLGLRRNYHKGQAALRHYANLCEPSDSLRFKLYSSRLARQRQLTATAGPLSRPPDGGDQIFLPKIRNPLVIGKKKLIYGSKIFVNSVIWRGVNPSVR